MWSLRDPEALVSRNLSQTGSGVMRASIASTKTRTLGAKYRRCGNTAYTVSSSLDVTNPGRWMAHCHMAEHHESGMMFSFDVVP